MTPNAGDTALTAVLTAEQQKYTWPSTPKLYEQALIVERAEGMYVWDAEGNRYLDCFGGILATSIGHARAEVVEAVSDQVAKIAHTSTLYINRPQAALAEKVAQITPGSLKKSFFTNSDAEAEQTAMVLARLYTGNREIVVLNHSHHGRAIRNIAASGRTSVPGTGVVHARAPYCYRCPFDLEPESCSMECARDVEETILTATSGRVAALISEPVMSDAGCVTPPKDYFKVVIEIIHRYGGIFICDEAQTAWGRTGDHWCGIEHWQVEPEMMTFADGMANGSPIGCTTATAQAADKYPSHTFSTFGGNPVTCAAALATIRVIEEDNLPRNARIVGDYLRSKLEALKEKHSVIGDVRGIGLMQAIECVKNRDSKEPDPQTVQRVFEGTRKRGVLIGKSGLFGNVIQVRPPLIATESDIDELVAALDGALSAASRVG